MNRGRPEAASGNGVARASMSFTRWMLVGTLGLALLASPAAVLEITTATADPGDTSIVTDPFPEMKNPSRCRGDECDRGRGRRDRTPGAVVLDCSGRRPGAAHTLRDAVKRAPINGEILILGAPQGRTCAADGTIIDKPLTIRPYDAIGSAYIEGTVPPPVSGAPIGEYTSVESDPKSASFLIQLRKAAEQLRRDSVNLTGHRPFDWDNKDKWQPLQTKADEKKEDLKEEREELWRQEAAGEEDTTAQQEAVHKAEAEYSKALKALAAEPRRKLCKIQKEIEALRRDGERLASAAQRAQDKTAIAAVRSDAAALKVVADDIGKKLKGDTDSKDANGDGTTCELKRVVKARARNAITAFAATLTIIQTYASAISPQAAAAPESESPATADQSGAPTEYEPDDDDQAPSAATLSSPDDADEKNASCLDVRLPTGDALNIVGVNFIVRSGKYPCVSVKAGTVKVQHSRIDSRGTRWAFDVKESGRLVLEDSRIETDGGGINARRATVDLRRVEIQLERGRRGIGAALTGADGTISDLAVIGGEVGLVVSSGSRGLIVDRPVISDSGVGIAAVGAPGQGTISVRNANIQRTIVGAWIRNNARAELLGGSVLQSQRVGVFINYSGALVRGLAHIEGAIHGLAISNKTEPETQSAAPAASEWSSLCTGDAGDGYGGKSAGEVGKEVGCDYLGDLNKELGGLGEAAGGMGAAFPSALGAVDIDQNMIRSTERSVIQLMLVKKTQTIRLTNNILDCPRGSSCVSGDHGWSRSVEMRGNRCTKNSWFSSCDND